MEGARWTSSMIPIISQVQNKTVQIVEKKNLLHFLIFSFHLWMETVPGSKQRKDKRLQV